MAILIVYYSRKGQNYWSGSIVDLKKGNTERVAEFILPPALFPHPSNNLRPRYTDIAGPAV